MQTEQNVIIVTRFGAFAQFLKESGAVSSDTPVYQGAVPIGVIKGSVVYGYLPTYLASHAERYVEMDLGRMRIQPGDDPDIDIVRKHARLTAYEVRRVEE